VQRYEIFSIIPHYRPGIYWCARRIPSTSSLCGIPEYSGGCREVFKKVKRKLADDIPPGSFYL
jgi:hypothetical protein